MIVEVIILVVGAYLGKNVKVSVSEESQRIAKRLLQTGLAQLPSADTVKGWAVGAIASARSQSPALLPVQEISDEVLKEIEEDSFFGKGVTFFDGEQKAAENLAVSSESLADAGRWSKEEGFESLKAYKEQESTSVLGSK